jgi:phenylacetate-coenzyme A ligase PaaK-like adenylate-forming protein
MPVEFFRSQKVLTATTSYEAIFESSGTTGMTTSRHYVTDLSIYEESFISCFKHFYGPPENYMLAALLPSYAERGNSSLVYMMNKLISTSTEADSGFYINNPEKLINTLLKAKAENRKAILLGVSYALLDLAERYSPDLSGIIVMETGGMKGRKREITREELHETLKTGFNIETVHSEYGMTELLSQAYSKGEGKYYCPPWMRIIIRDPHDPLTIVDQPGETGGINIIDLANLNSCAFIATNDLGKLHDDGGFEVLGRFDSNDIRGCNLMVE